jgi:hypothetical protein
MGKLAYIATVVYIPLLIAFMMLTSDSRLLDYVWFFADKLFLGILLIANAKTQLIKRRAKLLYAAGGCTLIYLAYLISDYNMAYRLNIWIAGTISLVYILGILYALNYDRKIEGKNNHN